MKKSYYIILFILKNSSIKFIFGVFLLRPETNCFIYVVSSHANNNIDWLPLPAKQYLLVRPQVA